MILTCRVCHRVKIDSQWCEYTGIEPDVAGICPTCLGWEMRVAEAKRSQEGRQLLRDRAAGYGPGTGDPFAGFREDKA